MNKELARIIQKNLDSITTSWTQAIVASAGPNYRGADRDDVEGGVRRCLAGFLDFIETGSPGMIREWNRQIAFKREPAAFGRKAGFDIDELHNALYLFRKVLLAFLEDHDLKRKDLLAIETIIAETLQTAIVDISRKYLVVMEKRLLGRYFAPELLDGLIENYESVFQPKSAKLTVFFSDIRGFTKLSQQLDREEMIEILNAYLARMTEIVFAHGGVLDKFIGDAVMVFFGEPQPLAVEEQALRAVRMSFQMLAAVDELKASLWKSYAESPVAIGIGINTGFVTVGHVGTKERMEYTVLGANVNLAARLEAAAQPGQILVTRRTLEPIKDAVTYEELGPMTFKNIAEPVNVFNITGLKS